MSDKTYYTLKLLISENTDTPIVFVKLSIFCILFSTSFWTMITICKSVLWHVMRLFVRRTMYVHEISCIISVRRVSEIISAVTHLLCQAGLPGNWQKGGRHDTPLHKYTNTQLYTNKQIYKYRNLDLWKYTNPKTYTYMSIEIYLAIRLHLQTMMNLLLFPG